MKIKLFTIPNLLTLSNLMCGSLAVVSTLVYGNLGLAFWLIVAGAAFDFFDGFAARLLKCPSPLGVQLDSLADMVSFGFAPAAIAYVMWGYAWTEYAQDWVSYAGMFVCFGMAAFSALRLAKFNIDETQHAEFSGLPTPANALFFASLGWISSHGGFVPKEWLLLILVVVMSGLMISNVRMFALKFSGFGWQGNALRYGFMILAVVLLVAAGIRETPIYAIPVIILLYILISLVRPLCCKAARPEENK